MSCSNNERQICCVHQLFTKGPLKILYKEVKDDRERILNTTRLSVLKLASFVPHILDFKGLPEFLARFLEGLVLDTAGRGPAPRYTEALFRTTSVKYLLSSARESVVANHVGEQ
eukprot:1168248-Pyramimonas_sp.AAC.1